LRIVWPVYTVIARFISIIRGVLENMNLRQRRGISNAVMVGVVVVIIVIAAVAAGYAVSTGGKTTTVTATTTPIASTTTIVTTVPTSSTSTSMTSKYKLALVLGGDETDDGFNAAAIQTAELMQNVLGWQVSISRDVQYAQQGQVLASYAQEGYTVVWAHGGQFLTSTIFTNSSVESKYPNTLFIQSPGPSAIELKYSGINLTKNIVVLGPSFQVTGYYLAGVLAAKMTQTKNVAVVIGEWYDYLSEEFYAFEAGVNATNPAVKVYASVPGTWSDPNTGYSVATTLIQQDHVDILANIADATGRGVVAAAQFDNVSVIGTVEDQVDLAPYNTMTSVEANFTQFIQPVIQSVMQSSFGITFGGKVVEMNLGYLSPYHNYNTTIPASVQTLVSNTATQIASGQITVPQIIKNSPPSGPS
jgi:basic membrane protein A and related proteins